MTPDPPPDSPALVVVIDVANVMGARADGWWRDRAGAALRLCREVAALAARGIPPDALPGEGLRADVLPADVLPADALSADALRAEGSAGERLAAGPLIFPRYVLVLEGRAREAADQIDADDPHVRIVKAPRSGDDTILGEASAVAASSASCLVVTADRELQERCRAVGATVTGPRWMLDLL